MVRVAIKVALGLLTFAVRLVLTFVSLASGADQGSAGATSQYQRRSSWDRRGYSWNGRPD